MEDKKIDLLANQPVIKAIFALSIPMIMGMMVQVFYNLADTYFIGLLGDANQLAAANMALPVFVILMGLASMIGTGASSYISRCLGQKAYEEAHCTTSIATALLGLISIVVMITGLFFAKPLVQALGGSGETYAYTFQYVVIMLLGGFGVIGNFAFGQLLRAEGNAMHSMMGMVIGTVLNLILDPLFIFGFDLGVAGAALATVIGNCVGLLYYVICFIKGKTLLKIQWKWVKFNKTIYTEIFKIGVPSSLTQILMGASTIVVNNIAIAYGTETVAGLGIATKIMMIGTFIFIGFSSGCQPLIGYNYGAHNYERVKLILKRGTQVTASVGIALLLLFTISSTFLIGMFTKDAIVIEKGTTIFKALIWSLPFLGAQMIATSAAQSMGKAIPSMILSISRQGILYIPLVLILNAAFSFNGFIYAQPITDLLMCLLAQLYIGWLIAKEVVAKQKEVVEQKESGFTSEYE